MLFMCRSALYRAGTGWHGNEKKEKRRFAPRAQTLNAHCFVRFASFAAFKTKVTVYCAAYQQPQYQTKRARCAGCGLVAKFSSKLTNSSESIIKRKTWRQSKNGRHGDVHDFSYCVFKDHSRDLTNIIKVLRHAPVPLESVACIQKIINRSSYMGEIANRYLMRVKQFSEEKAKNTVPEFCIYTSYTFSFDYEAKNPKPTATVTLNGRDVLVAKFSSKITNSSESKRKRKGKRKLMRSGGISDEDALNRLFPFALGVNDPNESDR